MSNKFSTKRINYLLQAKAYEKHNLSKTEYIDLCREKWGDSDSEVAKVIVDRLYPISVSELFKKAGYHLDHALSSFMKQLDYEATKEAAKEQQWIVSCTKIQLVQSDGNNIAKMSSPKVSYPSYWSDKSVKEGTYFLAYFDVLGFKDLVESKKPIEVFEMYEKILKKARVNKPYLVLQKDFEEIQEAFEKEHTDVKYSLPILTKVPFKFAYYSDTILFWAPGDINNFSGFVAKCIDYYNIALKNQILLRGVITHGKAILNKKKNIFIGEPIIEAANLEKEQQWSGVIFGDSIYRGELFHYLDSELAMAGLTFHMKRIVKGNIFNVVMNWMGRLKPDELREAFKILKDIKHNTSGKPVDYLNNTMRAMGYYLDCVQLDNAARNLISISPSFPSKIKQSAYKVRANKDSVARLFYVELIDGRLVSGFVFVMKPETFEMDQELKELLPFVDICNITEYGKFLTSRAESAALNDYDWLDFIPIVNVKAIYS